MRYAALRCVASVAVALRNAAAAAAAAAAGSVLVTDDVGLGRCLSLHSQT